MARPRSARAAQTPPLTRALDQTEKVKEKVAEAAAELSDVNEVLKENVAEGAPPLKVRHALDKSEAVEVKVLEAAEELVAVNKALTEEVADRDALEHRVRQGESALIASVAAEEASRRRALHDAVTGLPNSTLFSDRLEKALEQADRHGWRFAVLFLDLDGFKQINDTHGHDIGDRVLQEVAERLRHSVRGADSVGRRGGDEFLVLALEVKDDNAAVALATKICDRLAEPMEFGGVTVTVGTSIGIAIYPDDANRPTDLLKCADIAMYVAKQGRLGVARYVASHGSLHGTTAPQCAVSSPEGSS
ncbi:MAG: GGDEF domain-containing protein [Gemmatimonadales bacterium]|nr:GGDEF domain-containing protein [Gemmatimonadales bacterium]